MLCWSISILLDYGIDKGWRTCWPALYLGWDLVDESLGLDEQRPLLLGDGEGGLLRLVVGVRAQGREGVRHPCTITDSSAFVPILLGTL